MIIYNNFTSLFLSLFIYHGCLCLLISENHFSLLLSAVFAACYLYHALDYFTTVAKNSDKIVFVDNDLHIILMTKT